MKLLLQSVCVLVLLLCQKSHGDMLKDIDSLSLPLEWHMWKQEHGKSYENVKEELTKHLVWMGNQEFINQHNKYSGVFGYTLKMNHLGDLVSLIIIYYY